MAAYMKSIERTCSCGKPARFAVFNTRNASCGEFCRPCAQRVIDKLDHDEAVARDRAGYTRVPVQPGEFDQG
jgi:hypothetical protein